jgi:hypothetical protein
MFAKQLLKLDPRNGRRAAGYEENGAKNRGLSKRLMATIGVFASLSLGPIDLAPILGQTLASAVQFTSPAEARVVRAQGRHTAHRAATLPAHRAATLPAHRPVHYPARAAGRGHVGRVAVVRPLPAVRPWYWGRVVAGVTIGTLIAVGAVGAVPHAPSDDLCWYWTDSHMAQGYWNYCVAPVR